MVRRIVESTNEFYSLMMVSDLGHLHMNQIKTLFRVLDKILWEPLGKEFLCFNSPNAYQYFLYAKDTHKASLLVLLEGTAREMCLMYIKETCINSVLKGLLIGPKILLTSHSALLTNRYLIKPWQSCIKGRCVRKLPAYDRC